MSSRTLLTPAARRPGAAAAVLLAAAFVLAGTAPASATGPAAGATGLHAGMMPVTSPDARAESPTGPAGYDSAALTAAATGVDVSRYQHPGGATVDWAGVAASGRRFAIVKATELYAGSGGVPILYTNPYLHTDLDGAAAAGLVVGVYAFGHPEFSAVTQADDFAAAIGTLPDGSLPPVLDLEVGGGLSAAQLQAWTQAFLDRLQQATGTVPMIYTGPGFWAAAMGGTTAFAGYPLWEAHWTTAAAPARFGGWSDYALWQFTDTAVVPGISGFVDEDRLGRMP